MVIGALLLSLLGGGTGSLDASAAVQAKAAPAAAPANAAELDRLLGPIALYPDALVAQMLLSATTPARVTELGAWLGANAALKGTELQDAATVEGFDPNLVALAIFPDVVKFMAERLDWTTALGKAFTADRSAVFDSIQRLRAQAQQSGALKDTPQQDVETTATSDGTSIIVIEPANPQVVYVPQYDPQVVYVDTDDDAAEAAVAGMIGFTAGIAIGAAIDNDYYYGPYGWHGGVRLYDDAWDDWSDAREDAREDWVDHRENLVEERGERAGDAREQRTDRTEIRQDGRADTQGERTERQQTRQESRPQSQAAPQARATAGQAGAGGSTYQSRGDSRGSEQARKERSGTNTDAFSGYSNGRSERAASTRGQRSRSGGGGGGGGRRR